MAVLYAISFSVGLTCLGLSCCGGYLCFRSISLGFRHGIRGCWSPSSRVGRLLGCSCSSGGAGCRSRFVFCASLALFCLFLTRMALLLCILRWFWLSDIRPRIAHQLCP